MIWRCILAPGNVSTGCSFYSKNSPGCCHGWSISDMFLILAWLSEFHLYLEKIIGWRHWAFINGKINIYYCLIIPSIKLYMKYWLTLFLSHATVYNRTSCDFNQPKRHLVLISRVKSKETCEKLYLVLVLYKEEKLSFILFQCLKIFENTCR